MNTEIFIKEESEQYFERNKLHSHSFMIDYLLEIFPKKELYNFNIAEFGIGNGQNLMLLKHFAKKTHGFDACKSAIELFSGQYAAHQNSKDFYSAIVNLAKPFESPIKYNLIIYGFFPYYVDDGEMKIVKENTLNCLDEESYVYVFDFMIRNNIIKKDSRNTKLNVYKRCLKYWLEYFKEFDLVDYRLFDSNNSDIYTKSDSIMKIDTLLSHNDDDWLFSALFRKRRK